jgi:transcriptional regulator with XRE-family HTH domain
MIIRKLRLQNGWSQEMVAEMSGLSVRTVQRIEQGKKSSMESLRSLAAVFEIDIVNLTEGSHMTGVKENISAEEERVIKQVKEIKGFYTHLIQFVVIVSALAFINYKTMPNYYWVIWVMIGWGAGILANAFTAFELINLFGVKWKKKEVEKRLGRKL